MSRVGPVGKKPTVRDVAVAAGVSKSLVSRAFVNPGNVGAESLEKIMNAASDLGFRPSWSARTLNNADGGFTGIVLADLYSASLAPIAIGASRRLDEAGHEVLLSSASFSEPGADAVLERASIAFLGDLRPAKLLIVGAVVDMSLLAGLAAGVPTVVAGSRDVGISTIAEVFTDDDVGLDLVIAHLLSHGHRRIAHIAGIGNVGRTRGAAYARAMVAHGLGGHIRIEQADFEERGGYQAMQRLLKRAEPPTAVAAAGDAAAIGALAAIRQEGVDVAVVGYGNTPAAAYHVTDLTSIEPHNQVIGARAAEALMTKCDAPANEPQQVRIEPSLIVRSSSRSASS